MAVDAWKELALLEAKSLDELAFEAFGYRWCDGCDRDVLWRLYHRLKDALRALAEHRQFEIQNADDASWLMRRGISLVFVPDRYTGGSWRFDDEELRDLEKERRERVVRELDERQEMIVFA